MAGTSIILPNGNPVGTSSSFVPLIIFQGESNSRGYALNSELTTPQLAVRPAVQVFQPDTNLFASMQIGVNNVGFDSSTHGWENGLATAVEAGLFTGFTQIYICKTGQGGSTVAEWNVGGGYLNEYIRRVQAAKALILNSGKIPLPFIWHSLGINDRLAGTDTTTWKANIIALFKNLRQYIGYAPIIEPQFMTGDNATYNALLTDIQATEKYFFTVSSSSASLRDPNHWNAQGIALLASRMADLTINTIGIGFENYTLTSLLALGGSAPTTQITSTLSTPSVTSQPADRTVVQGSTAIFSVSATGNPTPTYQWQIQQSGAGAFSNIIGATSSSYTTGSLTVAADNGDVFRCVLTNSQGSATSNSATLTVTASASLTAVNWIALSSGVSNAVPSSGYISSALANVGGKSDRSIDATQPFSFVYDLEDATNSQAIVVYLDDDNGTNYSWDSSNPFLTGTYMYANVLSSTSLGGNAGTQVATGLTYPTKVKTEKSGNDVIFSTSTDGGITYTPRGTATGVLSGKTTIYLKALFAVAASGNKIKVSQS